MSMRYYSEVQTPIGPVTLVSDGAAVTHLSLRPAAAVTARGGAWTRDDAINADAREQLAAYFAGELRAFSLPLAPRGSAFQQRVWSALQRIPYGETTSYGAIAAAIGMPGNARAVGAANGSNPIAIIVPCHRVIGADGSLTGYGGGLERKKFLLEHEAAVAGVRGQLEFEIPG